MKLINITTRYYILLFMVILALWSVAFYFIMKFEVYQSSDEILYNRVQNIKRYFTSNPDQVRNNTPLSDYQVDEINEAEFNVSPKDVYSDTLVYEVTDNEYDEYRKLSATFALRERYFRITVLRPRLESTEIFNTITFTLLPLSLLMIVALVVAARIMNAGLWKPFYDVVNFLSTYRVDQGNKLAGEKTAVTEFGELIESIQLLVHRNEQVFGQQKQFIENASHETQTPLAIIQSQMEILLQLPELTDRQAEIIQSALRETDRLTKLNKTLLLLSKIDNQQFMDRTEVNLGDLARKLVSYFDEKKERLNLCVEIQGDGHVVSTNAVLAEVMMGNLIKNSFVHNIENGDVRVEVSSNRIRVMNTGKPIAANDKLFERFSKQGSADGWGLGLPIVKKIAEVNGWTIHYDYQEGVHRFSVEF
jgi:signal transduction histidine kinase